MSVDSSLNEDHEVLGTEFCSGYTDGLGKWNTGFYCPSSELSQALYCCGTPTNKYCCARREHVPRDDYSSLPLLLGVVLGVMAAITIVTLVSCRFCSCCILYKKRQPNANGGCGRTKRRAPLSTFCKRGNSPLYRLHCSSTASGVANMYSFSNHNSLVGTPIDTAVLVDVEPAAVGGRDAGRGMARGHTFSREAENTAACELRGRDLREMSDDTTIAPALRPPEPPPPYDSPGTYAIRDLQHPGPSEQSLSTTFSPCSSTMAAGSVTVATVPLRPMPEESTSSPASSDESPPSVASPFIVARPAGTPLGTDVLYHSTKF